MNVAWVSIRDFFQKQFKHLQTPNFWTVVWTHKSAKQTM